MAIRRRSRVSRGTPQRKFVWARSRGSNLLADGAINSWDLLGGFEAAYGANLIGATVVRIRGVIAAVAVTGGGDAGLRFGAAVFPDATPNVNSLGPYSSEHYDWMLWEPFLNLNAPDDLDDVANRVIDVKSSRKLEELNQALLLRVEAAPGVTQGGWRYAFDLSIGLKLA